MVIQRQPCRGTVVLTSSLGDQAGLGHSGLLTFGKVLAPQQHAAWQEGPAPVPQPVQPGAPCERLGGEAIQRARLMPDHTQGEQGRPFRRPTQGGRLLSAGALLMGGSSLRLPSLLLSLLLLSSSFPPGPFTGFSSWLCSSLAHSEACPPLWTSSVHFRGTQGKVNVTPDSYCTFSRDAGRVLGNCQPLYQALWDFWGVECSPHLPCLPSHLQRQPGLGLSEANLGDQFSPESWSLPWAS